MRYLILIALAGILYMPAQAQITLENTHNTEILKVTRFNDSLTYYYSTSTTDMVLYSMDHSVYKTINFPFTFEVDSMMIYFVTETLFDSDTGVEYMLIDYFVGQDGQPAAKGSVSIYDDDATVLLSDDSVLVDRFFFLGHMAPTILNTEDGPKLILRKSNGGVMSTKVYSLPGTFTPLAREEEADPFGLAYASPNPAVNYTRVDYTLPEGVNNGQVLFYDLKGVLVKQFKVDRSFDHLMVSTRQLPTGTYIYQMLTIKGASQGRKLIRID